MTVPPAWDLACSPGPEPHLTETVWDSGVGHMVTLPSIPDLAGGLVQLFTAPVWLLYCANSLSTAAVSSVSLQPFLQMLAGTCPPASVITETKPVGRPAGGPSLLHVCPCWHFLLFAVGRDDATGQGEGEGHPGQGEAVTEAAPRRMIRQDLLGMNGVDQCPGEHRQACGETGTKCHAMPSRRLHIPTTHGTRKPPEGKWAAPMPAGSCGLLPQLRATRLQQTGLGHFNLWVPLSIKWEDNIYSSIH